MTVPTTASVSVVIDAPARTVYDLVSDVTRMGEWSPECRSCDWIDEPGTEGSRFKGHNRRGPARWTTTARVMRAQPGVEFTFATQFRGQDATRWSYRFDESADGTSTTVTESFESLHTPWVVAMVERTVLRSRQSQLEAGLRSTLEQLKLAAEAVAASS